MNVVSGLTGLTVGFVQHINNIKQIIFSAKVIGSLYDAIYFSYGYGFYQNLMSGDAPNLNEAVPFNNAACPSINLGLADNIANLKSNVRSDVNFKSELCSTGCCIGTNWGPYGAGFTIGSLNYDWLKGTFSWNFDYRTPLPCINFNYKTGVGSNRVYTVFCPADASWDGVTDYNAGTIG